MTIQQIVDPGKIEVELIRLWDELAHEKTRACLFNLIVFNSLSPRTDYIRDIVQKCAEKFPCRVLFITHDPNATHPFLKTAVSVIGAGSIACDYIDIGTSGPDLTQVPFLITPHIIPDLPTSLLWTEDPTQEHPLFAPLCKFANRVIFDSESADSLLSFCQQVIHLQQKTRTDTADLNWARTEGWRDLLNSLQIDKIQAIQITYNARPTEFFCHLKVQSMYLLAWIATRMNWKLLETNQNLQFVFADQKATIQPAVWEKLGPGSIISVQITTPDNRVYFCSRIPSHYHHVKIELSSPEQCELPYQYVLGKTAAGQSLTKEIITKGTSSHYLQMLASLKELDRDHLC